MGARCIEEIRKEFHEEWLLVTVDTVDAATGFPSTGRLISHGKSAEALWQEAGKCSEPVMVLFSDDWPEDLAACFLTSA